VGDIDLLQVLFDVVEVALADGLDIHAEEVDFGGVRRLRIPGAQPREQCLILVSLPRAEQTLLHQFGQRACSPV
jgi:hypothetical protein